MKPQVYCYLFMLYLLYLFIYNVVYYNLLIFQKYHKTLKINILMVSLFFLLFSKKVSE